MVTHVLSRMLSDTSAERHSSLAPAGFWREEVNRQIMDLNPFYNMGMFWKQHHQMLNIHYISRINLKTFKMLLKRTWSWQKNQCNLNSHQWFIMISQAQNPPILKCICSALTCSCRGRESPCARRWRPQGPWPRLWRAVTSYWRHRPVLATRGPPLKRTWSPHLPRIYNKIPMKWTDVKWGNETKR